jgi:hypothetical protein
MYSCTKFSMYKLLRDSSTKFSAMYTAVHVVLDLVYPKKNGIAGELVL